VGGRGGTDSSLPWMGEGGDATGSPRSRCSWWGAVAAAVGRSRVRSRGKRDRERDTDLVPQEAWGVRGACGRTHCTVETKHRLQATLRMQYSSTTDHSV
jgi:hypothetical protein